MYYQSTFANDVAIIQCYEISDLLKMTAGVKDRQLLRTHQHRRQWEG